MSSARNVCRARAPKAKLTARPVGLRLHGPPLVEPHLSLVEEHSHAVELWQLSSQSRSHGLDRVDWLEQRVVCTKRGDRPALRTALGAQPPRHCVLALVRLRRPALIDEDHLFEQTFVVQHEKNCEVAHRHAAVTAERLRLGRQRPERVEPAAPPRR
jgi:hypothetical protein